MKIDLRVNSFRSMKRLINLDFGRIFCDGNIIQHIWSRMIHFERILVCVCDKCNDQASQHKTIEGNRKSNRITSRSTQKFHFIDDLSTQFDRPQLNIERMRWLLSFVGQDEIETNEIYQFSVNISFFPTLSGLSLQGAPKIIQRNTFKMLNNNLESEI